MPIIYLDCGMWTMFLHAGNVFPFHFVPCGIRTTVIRRFLNSSLDNFLAVCVFQKMLAFRNTFCLPKPSTSHVNTLSKSFATNFSTDTVSTHSLDKSCPMQFAANYFSSPVLRCSAIVQCHSQ